MTPNQQTLLDLATRAEGVAGADRELDVLIHEAVTTFPPRRGGVGWADDAIVVPAFPGWVILPHYTASLDQALTLVPEGWRLWTGDFSVIGRFVWMLVGSPAPWADPEDGSEHITPQYVAGIGAQSAPAMVSAALRARAAQCAPSE